MECNRSALLTWASVVYTHYAQIAFLILFKYFICLVHSISTTVKGIWRQTRLDDMRVFSIYVDLYKILHNIKKRYTHIPREYFGNTWMIWIE